MTDAIDWLENQTEFPKFYWRSRDGDFEFVTAGLSVLETGITVGGHAFMPDCPPKDALWDGFPRQTFFSPSHIYRCRESVALQELGERRPLFCTDLPDRSAWETLVSDALEEIRKGTFEKVVLARRSSLLIETQPLVLLRSLRQQSRRATVFMLQLSPSVAFMGATPERLYKRKGRRVMVDALAATRPRGNSPEEDVRLAQELVNHPKDKREFALVKESIQELMAPLCVSWSWSGHDRVVTTPTVQHLYNAFEAQLKEDVSDNDLLEVLHPTAAIGGKPRKAALDFIAKNEPFERGWYASPIGYAFDDEAEFAVAIRSALIKSGQMHLFAGTGIVEGSDAAKEWHELEHKIELWKRLDSATPHGAATSSIS